MAVQTYKRSIFLPAPATEPKHDLLRTGSDTMHLFFLCLNVRLQMYRKIYRKCKDWGEYVFLVYKFAFIFFSISVSVVFSA